MYEQMACCSAMRTAATAWQAPFLLFGHGTLNLRRSMPASPPSPALLCTCSVNPRAPCKLLPQPLLLSPQLPACSFLPFCRSTSIRCLPLSDFGQRVVPLPALVTPRVAAAHKENRAVCSAPQEHAGCIHEARASWGRMRGRSGWTDAVCDAWRGERGPRNRAASAHT